MLDRKKVIEGLKCCKPAWFTVENCVDEHCPYNCYGHNATTGCVDHLIDDVLELLKEQEPVSVAGPDNYEEYWDREAICPDCGTHWMSYDKNGKRITKYCPGCGRLVKWQ